MKHYNQSTNYYYAKCYESHKPLDIGDYKIYGGSCSRPVILDADVYVGFDLGIARSSKALPWQPGESFLFYIPDMGVPDSAEEFKNLIDWLELQLIANKVVHLGCIGGHGRTGMVLSALVKQMLGVDDAITYVRDRYCAKVVESAKQVAFLNAHFGITVVKGAKELPAVETYRASARTAMHKPVQSHATQAAKDDIKFKIMPITSHTCIFGPEVVFSTI